MANIKSQIKRNRQSEAARQRNKVVRSKTRTMVKKFEAAIEAGDKDAAAEAYKEASSALDKAANKNVMHDNAASRKKARLAKRLASL
ncbi:MAG: small subunit ribosomal protein S20 [Nitriliruptoraceae bacterium]